MKRQRPQWTIAQVYGSGRTTLAVWTALVEMATKRGSAVLTPTRTTISEMTGIVRHKTISAALTALESAGWIDRTHVPVTDSGRQTATLLRITLRRGRYAPLTAKAKRGATNENGLRRGRYAPHTGARKTDAVEGATRPLAMGRYAPLDSPKGEGAPLAGFEAVGVAVGDLVSDEHPSVKVEREKMAAARAKRNGEPAIEGGDRGC